MGFTYAWSNSYVTDQIRDSADALWTDVDYSGLSTTTPVIDGTNLTEPASGYARILHTAEFGTVAASRAITNDGVITFAAATANWGTVTHATAHDAVTAGNFLAFGALTAAEQVFDTDVVKYEIGDLTFSLGGGISDFLANSRTLDNMIGGTPLAPPTTFFVGLSTTAPNSDGTNVTEPVGGAYARVGVTSVTTEWDVASNGGTANTNNITFAQATGSWGTLTHWVIYDASTAGNLYYFAPLGASQAVVSGDQVKFLPQALTISVT